MGQLKTDDSNDDQEDRYQANEVIGISKKDDTADNSSCSANSRPNSIGSANRDCLHGLRNGKETQHDEDNSDDARDQSGKTLAELERDGKADFKKASEQ